MDIELAVPDRIRKFSRRCLAGRLAGFASILASPPLLPASAGFAILRGPPVPRLAAIRRSWPLDHRTRVRNGLWRNRHGPQGSWSTSRISRKSHSQLEAPSSCFVASGVAVVGLCVLLRTLTGGTSRPRRRFRIRFAAKRASRQQQAAQQPPKQRRTASHCRAAAPRAAEARCDGGRQRPGHPPRCAGHRLRRALRRRGAGRPGQQAADHASLPNRSITVTDAGDRRRNRPHGRRGSRSAASSGSRCSSASAASTPQQYKRDILWPTLALRKLAADQLDGHRRAASEGVRSAVRPGREVPADRRERSRNRPSSFTAKLADQPDDFARLAMQHSHGRQQREHRRPDPADSPPRRRPGHRAAKCSRCSRTRFRRSFRSASSSRF